MTGRGFFLGFTYCPVCKEETRHYAYARKFTFKRVIWCEECNVTRFEIKGDEIAYT